MNASLEPEDRPDCKRTAQTLLAFLLALFDMKKNKPVVAERAGQTASDGSLDWLAAIARQNGLHVMRVSLTPREAGELSSDLAPLIGLPENGKGWLALHGFRSGRVKAAFMQGELPEEQLLRPAAIAALLNAPDGQPRDWLLVQPQTPLEQAASHDGHHHTPPHQRLLAIIKAENHDFWLLLGLAVGSGLLALAPPVAVQALVNTVAMGGMGQPLAILSFILFVILLFSGAVYVLESYLVELIQRRIFVRLAADLSYRLPKVRCEVYDTHHGAELVNRFFDVLTVQKAGSALLLDGVTLLMQTVVGLTLLAFYHPFLLAFDIVLTLLLAFILFVLGRGALRTALEESKAKYDLVAWLEIVARNLLAFKSDGGPAWAVERTDALAHAYLAGKRAHYRVLLRQIIGSVALYAVATTALLAIGGYLVIIGQLTLGQLVASELIITSVLGSLSKFGKQLEGFYDLLAGVSKIGHLLDLPREREQGLSAKLDGPVAVSVRGLVFGYGSKRPVLEGLNLSVAAGERVALLGGHGSGKSSLAQLLYGLRQPWAGSIEYGGMEIGHLRLDALRARLAVVGDLEIIEDTLFENVRLGRERVGMEEAEQVLESVGLTAELDGWPGAGLAIEVGPNGSPLSTTQAKLLMLARGIVGQPGLLVLDGILDEMDSATQQRLAAMLSAATAPWTLLVLTSSRRVADLFRRVVELPSPAMSKTEAATP